MSHGDRIVEPAAGLPRRRPERRSPFAAIADDAPPLLRRPVPPRGRPHPRRRRAAQNFLFRVAGSPGDWTMHAFREQAIAAHPRPGRRRRRDLRPLRRRRFRRRGAAAPRGDRRPAHLRLRRHRPAALRRGRGGGRPVPRPLQHPAGPSSTPADAFLGALAGVSDPEDKRKTIGATFIDVFDAGGAKLGGSRLPRPGHALPRRDRERLASRAPASPSSRTTMSAACPSA